MGPLVPVDQKGVEGFSRCGKFSVEFPWCVDFLRGGGNGEKSLETVFNTPLLEGWRGRCGRPSNRRQDIRGDPSP